MGRGVWGPARAGNGEAGRRWGSMPGHPRRLCPPRGELLLAAPLRQHVLPPGCTAPLHGRPRDQRLPPAAGERGLGTEMGWDRDGNEDGDMDGDGTGTRTVMGQGWGQRGGQGWRWGWDGWVMGTRTGGGTSPLGLGSPCQWALDCGGDGDQGIPILGRGLPPSPHTGQGWGAVGLGMTPGVRGQPH